MYNASISQFLAALAISLSLATNACAQVQADRFACEPPDVETSSSEAYTGTVNGELKVDETVVPLTRAYAIAEDRLWGNAKALPNDPSSPPEWLLLITDQDISDNLLQHFRLDREIPTQFILDGSIKGMLISLDPERYNIVFLYPPPPNWGLSTFGQRFEPGKLQISENQIAGEIRGSALLLQDFAYKLSFKAPIQPLPFSSTVFTGQEAFEAPPLNVYLAYSNALQQRNLERMRQHLKSKSLQSLNRLVSELGEDQFFTELESYLNLVKDINRTQDSSQLQALSSRLGQEKVDALAALSQLFPTIHNEAMLQQHLHKVVIRGSKAKIVLKWEEPNFSSISLSMTCENGSWKL